MHLENDHDHDHAFLFNKAICSLCYSSMYFTVVFNSIHSRSLETDWYINNIQCSSIDHPYLCTFPCVCVFRQTVPLLSLRLPSEEPSWQTVSDKGKRHSAPNNGAQTPSGTSSPNQKHTWKTSTPTHSLSRFLYTEWENRGSRKPNKTAPQSASSGRVHKQHSWPPQGFPDEQAGGRNKFRCASLAFI